ncbi:MAG TPA: two-component regulator propeller domain-containing protein [Bryobacteraceae bacterium]|nr:two-component regulator propeller domain-containing protein [Bryobacteraceae bacterium]
MKRFGAAVALLCALFSNLALALDPRKALTQYSASVWTQEQGLPQDAITAIAQTSDGYLWLGTDEGLARFDGYEFVSLSHESGAPAASSIAALAGGKDGALWIGSRAGLTLFKGGRFQTYTRKDGLPGGLVSDLFIDHAGILWVVAGGNLSRFDGAHFTTFIRGRDVTLQSVRAVTESVDHELYICGNSSVAKFVNGKFVTVIGPDALGSDFPSHIQADRNGNLWITGARGVIERLKDGTLKRYRRNEGLSDAFGMNTVIQDRGGTIWVGTDWGLSRLEGHKFRNLPDSRDGSPARCIFEDREGNLWVGSDNGLTRYRDDLFTSLGKSEGLPENGPTTLLQDHKGIVWAGYDDGLLMINSSTHLLAVRVSSARLFSRHLHETPSGELLVPSRQGLIRIREGRQTTFIAPDPQGRKTVFDALEDSSGRLWLALPNGLGELEDGRLKIVIPAGPLYRDDSFYALAASPDGVVWAGTLSDGLWRYSNGQKRLFTTSDGLTSDQVRSLYLDGSGTLWIGTQDGGLNSFQDGKFVAYRARDGILSDNIHGITDDGESLWLSTSRGISRVAHVQLNDFAHRKIRFLHPINYGVDDGLRSAQANGGERLADGTIWFATNRGIAIYDPKVNETAPLPPLAHILDLSAGRHSFGNIHPRLPAGNGRVQIRYTGIHLRAPDRVQYSYMLDGLDAEWSSADSARLVNYDSLEHGHFRFRVKAEIPGGSISESAIDFDVDPHFYETVWFRALLVAMGAGLIVAAYKFRERQVRSRFALVLAERARLAREVHDTLAQGYVGIASQLDVVDLTMPSDAAPARSALALARRMARHSITEARRSLMDLRASALEDQNLAVALESGAGRWTAGSDTAVNVSVKGDASHLPEEVAHHVFRIAQEAVANAVSHAAPHAIHVELRIEANQLRLQIEDDGCGFEPGDAFTSKKGHFGLIGMRERAERIRGRLDLTSGRGKGTRVAVVVPLQ